ncbi:MAG: sugar-binding domain-containing protein, partial [Eubacteriales bacterium]
MPIFKPYFKDPGVCSVNEEEPRAYFIPYADQVSAAQLDRARSPYFKSLCGEWAFRYYENVNELDEDFTAEEYFSDEYEFTDTITVPRNWQTVLGRGYDVPNYTNVNYPYPLDPPHIPDKNPCGVYMRDFYLTEEFCAKELFLNFEGVDSC